MRTTITLEKDVASRIERLKKDRSFKELINEALRAGLDQLEHEATEPEQPFRMNPVRGGPTRTDLDNVSEILAEIEGDQHR